VAVELSFAEYLVSQSADAGQMAASHTATMINLKRIGLRVTKNGRLCLGAVFVDQSLKARILAQRVPDRVELENRSGDAGGSS
jgi:hypothetical protein